MDQPRVGRPDLSKPYTPYCNLKCKGTQRSAWDSPAVWANMPNGEKGLACTCCAMPLRKAVGLEQGIADAPNIAPMIDQSRKTRWVCDQCGYDVVTLPELKAKA